MRSALIVAMLLGSISQAEALDRGNWMSRPQEQTKLAAPNFDRNLVKQMGTVTLTV
jgi:hypothetical protein